MTGTETGRHIDWAIAMHGGAGPMEMRAYGAEEALMSQLLEHAATQLDAGASGLDVATLIVRELEASGHHIAGKGASPNRAGDYELDASIMCGATRRAGAVAALQGFVSPIEVARAVMEHTPHVLLVGQGAAAFAGERGLARVEDPASYYVPAVRQALADGELAHGTVGCVVRDTKGRLAAATSTGGLLGKTPGRVGDSPLIGLGCWADERVAVSCTGQGEYFMRAAVAADISARMRYGGQTLDAACAGALEDMALQGGDGGLIAIDATGQICLPFRSVGMKRAWADSHGARGVRIFA